MIGYLKGEILDQSDGKVLLLATNGGSGGGVGYLVATPQGAAYLGLLPGKAVELFIHTHVREDALDLYGFVTRVEKELFLTLLGVNGIGPKAAMAILSASEPGDLIQAILDDDTATLTRIPGIGKKTAERVVLEISDKIRKRMDMGALSGARHATGTGAVAGPLFKGSGPKEKARDLFNDAKAALVGLGYRENDVTAILNRLVADPANLPRAAEDLVKTALRQML